MDIKPIPPQNENTNTGPASGTPPPTQGVETPNAEPSMPQPQVGSNHVVSQGVQDNNAPAAASNPAQDPSPAPQVQPTLSVGQGVPSSEGSQPFMMKNNEPQAGQAQAGGSQVQSVVNPDTSTPSPQPFSMDNSAPSSVDETGTQQQPLQQAGQSSASPDIQGAQPASAVNLAQVTPQPNPTVTSGATPQPGTHAPAPTVISPQQQQSAVTMSQSATVPAQAQAQTGAFTGQGATPPQAQPGVSSGPQAQPNQPTMAPPNGGDSSSAGKKKKLGLIVGAAVSVMAIVSGVVFGYVIPNRPENVFSAGLDRSGQAINGLMVQLAEMETADQMNKMQATADMQIEMEGMTFQGDARVRFDETASESTFSLQSTSGGANFELSGDVLTTISDQSEYPDIYLQLTGITALGLDAFIPGISRYDGRWIHMPSSFLEEAIGPLESQADAAQEMPDPQEITSLMVDVSEVVRDSLLTSDKEKSVFEMTEIVGEEDVDGRSAYRYKVSVQEQNFESFCVALAEKIESSDYYDVVSGAVSAEPLDTSGCAEAAEDLNQETIDIWVDRQTKLISKIRFTDPEMEQEYSELGLSYEGGDDVGLYLRGISEDQTVELSMQTNFESLKTTGAVVVEQNGMSGFEFTMNISAEPYQDAIEASPPETAVTFEQMFEDLLGSSGGFTLGRQTDDEVALPLASGIANSENTIEMPEPSIQMNAPVQLPSFRDIVRSYNNPPSTETLE